MLNSATYGAKVQSTNKASPRGLLKDLIDDNPRAEKVRLLALLRDQLLKEDAIEYLDAVIEYWFANNYHSLVEAPARPRPDIAKAAKQAAVAAIKDKVTARIREEAEMILLDMLMPTGKALRDSTGKECAKAGGWLSKIATKVKPSQKVGAALSEAQVRALFKA